MAVQFSNVWRLSCFLPVTGFWFNSNMGGELTLQDISSFKQLVLWPRIISLGCVPWALEENVHLLLLGGVLWVVMTPYSLMTLSSRFLLIFRLGLFLVSHQWRSHQSHCGFVHFSSQFYHFLIPLFFSSIVCCIHRITAAAPCLFPSVIINVPPPLSWFALLWGLLCQMLI